MEHTAKLEISIPKSLRETMRTGRDFVHVRYGCLHGMFARSLYSQEEAQGFINSLDSFVKDGLTLKAGDTTFVSKIRWQENDLVIKRYNHQNCFHSLRHTIKRSRACRCWLWGHRLLMSNIGTPAPVAFVEQKRFGLIWQSYIITQFADAPNLYKILENNNVSADALMELRENIAQLFVIMKKMRIFHSDMKYNNILVSGTSPLLIDLDSMRNYRYSPCRRTMKARMSLFLDKLDKIIKTKTGDTPLPQQKPDSIAARPGKTQTP